MAGTVYFYSKVGTGIVLTFLIHKQSILTSRQSDLPYSVIYHMTPNP